jgi:hypothetical protein
MDKKQDVRRQAGVCVDMEGVSSRYVETKEHKEIELGDAARTSARNAPALEPPYVFGPDLLDALPTAEQLGVTAEMMEAASELSADSDGNCIGTLRLEALVRLILHLARTRS